jgi:hypothetical protein
MDRSTKSYVYMPDGMRQWDPTVSFKEYKTYNITGSAQLQFPYSLKIVLEIRDKNILIILFS